MVVYLKTELPAQPKPWVDFST